MENNEKRHFSFFWPILLIALGVYLFLANTGSVQGFTADSLLRLWPILLIVGGLDGYLQRNGFVGSTVAIGLGVIFLMANFGYLNVSPWDVIIRLWPIFIIGLGLDLIIGKKGTWSPVVGILVGTALAAGIFFLAVSTPGAGGTVYVEQIALAAEDSTQVEGELTIGAGSLNLEGGASETQLVEGEFNLRQGENLNQNVSITDQNAFYRLSTEGVSSYMPFTGGNGLLGWDLQMNSTLPTDLSVEMGAGEARIDVRDTNVESFRFEMGAGHVEIILPAAGTLQAEIQNAVGDMVIYVPIDTAVIFDLDTALTTVSVPQGYVRTEDRVQSAMVSTSVTPIHVDLSQAVGIVTIRELP
jgi:hypothetical protein